MRGIRPNLSWCTSIEDSNRVESAGRSAYTSKWVTIWFSASWILTNLPTCRGLRAPDSRAPSVVVGLPLNLRFLLSDLPGTVGLGDWEDGGRERAREASDCREAAIVDCSRKAHSSREPPPSHPSPRPHRYSWLARKLCGLSRHKTRNITPTVASG